jgi:WD40 repeat protein
MSPRRDAEAPTPPAVVNVFKRCGASVTRSGRVSESVDKHLGRKALVVDGDVPAAHFVRLPKVGKPGLRLAGAYAYLQVRLDPARYFAAHIDVVCVDRARPTRSDASVDYQVGRKVVRVSVSNLYKSDGSQKKKQRGSDTRRGESSVESFGAVTHHLQPPHAGWFCLRVDVRASVRDAQNANANERKELEKEKGGTKKSATRLTFESIKSFHVGGAVSVRNVFVSETPFDEESAPAETRASTKPDAVITWLDAGPVDESFMRTRENERSVQKRGEDEDELLETAGPVFSAADADLEPSDEDAKKTVVEETFGPTNKDAETTTRRAGSVATVREGGVFPEIPSRESHSNPASEPGGSDAEAFLRASAFKSSAFDPRHASVTKHLDPVLTLRAVIGASCETSASIAATRDGTVAYAADKAVVVVSLDDGNPGDVLEKTFRQQILLGHAEAVSCVRFSEDGEIMATAQRGAFPSVFLWRRGGENVETGSGSGNETKKKKKPFALLASFRASCASAVSLSVALCADGGTRVAILGDTPSGSFQTASLEVWDVPSGKPFGLASVDREPFRERGRSSVAKRTLFEVLKETTSATCVAFAPGRDDRLFACGDGFVVELRLSCLKPGDDELTLITKPACFKDLDLAALGTNDERESAETYAFTTLAFLSERTSEESDANGKETVSLFVGTRRGVIARFAVLNDDSDGDSNDPHAACAPDCAFRLHDDAVASLAFFSEDERRFAATASADGTVRVWPADFSTAHLLEAAHDAPTRVVGAAFCRRTKSGTETDQAGLVVVTATSDGAVGCLDLSDKRYAFLTTSPSPSTRAGARAVTSVCHSRYGQIVCAACDDGAARGWDANTGALVFVCKETGDVLDRDPATSVCFRPFRDENADENARDVRDVWANSQRLVLAVGHASGAVRVFSLFSPNSRTRRTKKSVEDTVRHSCYVRSSRK